MRARCSPMRFGHSKMAWLTRSATTTIPQSPPPEEPPPASFEVGRLTFSVEVRVMEYYTRDAGKRHMEDPSLDDILWRRQTVEKVSFFQSLFM